MPHVCVNIFEKVATSRRVIAATLPCCGHHWITTSNLRSDDTVLLVGIAAAVSARARNLHACCFASRNDTIVRGVRCWHLRKAPSAIALEGRALARLWHWTRSRFWCRWWWCTATPVVSSIEMTAFLGLAVIRPGFVIAIPIIELDGICTFGISPESQVAVCSVIAVWLTIGCAAEPPRARIRCPPSCLLRSRRLHGMPCAPTATILRTSDIDDPVGSAQRHRRGEKSLPICPGCWRENLHTFWATVLLGRLVNRCTFCALDQDPC